MTPDISPDVQKHIDTIRTNETARLALYLNRSPRADEIANSINSASFIIPVLLQEIATIKARLDNAKI